MYPVRYTADSSQSVSIRYPETEEVGCKTHLFLNFGFELFWHQAFIFYSLANEQEFLKIPS